MKIAMLSYDNPYDKFNGNPPVGGTFTHQKLLEEGLRHLGYEVDTFYPPNNLNILSIKRKMLLALFHPSVIWSTYHRHFYKLKMKINFFSQFDFSTYDVIHSHYAFAIYNIDHDNIILTLHGYYTKNIKEALLAKNLSQKQISKIIKLYEQIIAESLYKAKHIIAVDHRIKEFYSSYYNISPQKFTVIFNATDTSMFRPVTDEEKYAIRSKLSLDINKFIILIPRRYVEKNGVIFAAQAAVKAKDPNLLFVFAGRGPLKEEIINITSHTNNVIILDEIPHEKIPCFYQASDVVLIPSITSTAGIEEATSISMLEGMATGKVVIATRIGGLKEVIKHMENGILIEQKNPNAILDAIYYAKEHYEELSYMRQNARQYVVNHHSYIRHAEKVAKIYQKVVYQTSS